MWSVDSQDWRITAGGQTEAGLLANVTEWANSLSTLTQGGNSLMHDLNNITVGAAIKALPILHPKVKLSPVGVCAGWNNASYVEQMNAVTPAAAASSSAGASATPGSATPHSVKSGNASSGAVKNSAVMSAAAAAVGAAIAAFAI
jgi:hypothetical protein